MRHTPWMHSNSLYHRHRFPAEISHCVWLYFRFALSFRDVEEMLAMRGVYVSYETVRAWGLKFGQTYANGLRRKSSRPLEGDLVRNCGAGDGNRTRITSLGIRKFTPLF